jgi:hypothetical protein
MTTSAMRTVVVRFALYCGPHLPIAVAARRVARALSVPLEVRDSPLRGAYYRWTGSGAADVLVQANVPDDDGVRLEPECPAHAALVYATGLDEAGYQALAEVAGLYLLDSDVLLVP